MLLVQLDIIVINYCQIIIKLIYLVCTLYVSLYLSVYTQYIWTNCWCYLSPIAGVSGDSHQVISEIHLLVMILEI